MPTTVFAKGENKGMRKVTARKSTGAPAVRDEALFSPTGELAPTDMQQTDETATTATSRDVLMDVDETHRKHEGNDFCSFCGNGGNLILCDKPICHLAFCSDCIPIPEDSLPATPATPANGSMSYNFTCPSCYEKETAGLKGISVPPYQPWANEKGYRIPKPVALGQFISPTRAIYPTINTSPLAILSVRLQGVNGIGLAPSLLHLYFQGYFTGNSVGKLIFRELEFSINSSNINKWADIINKAVEEFESANVNRIVVFLNTHSDPITGDLHVRPGSAATADNFLPILFGGQFPSFIQKLESSTLVLFICGGIVKLDQGRCALERYINKNIFHGVICFGCVNLVPHYIGTFIIKVMLRHLLNNEPLKQSVRTFLFEEIALGSHTDVFLYSCRFPPVETDREKRDYPPPGRNWTLIRYVWAHAKHRPFTIIRPIQCRACFRLRTMESNATAEGQQRGKSVTLELVCSGCGYREQHHINPQMRLLEGAGQIAAFVNDNKWAGGTQGEWCWEIMQPAMLSR